MKKLLAIFTVICVMFSLCGCVFLKDMADSAGFEKPKTFEYDGLSIELTNDFLRMDFVSEEYDFIIGTEEITVLGVKVDVEDNENISDMDYAVAFRNAFIDNNPTELTEISSIPTLNYEFSDDNGKNQTAAVMFYKGTDCFWVVTFATLSNNFDELYDEICGYAKTVKCD